MNKLILTLMILLSTTAFSSDKYISMNDNQKQKLIIIKQQTQDTNAIVGLKLVPDFYEGSIESYCLELANKLSSHQSLVAFRPLDNGKSYTVVSLNSGFISLSPFSTEDGFTSKEALANFTESIK